MKKSESNQEDDMETRQSIVREYLEVFINFIEYFSVSSLQLKKCLFQFKELILTIDQEENKIDENKPNSNVKINATENQKLTVLQQKLFEGIEKTKVIKLKIIIM